VLKHNYEGVEGLRSGWGLSYLVEGFEKTVLFDTSGDGEILLHSMKKLKVEPDSVNAVMLPHNHWDHTCGLNTFLQRKGGASVDVPRVIPESFKSATRKAGARVTETSRLPRYVQAYRPPPCSADRCAFHENCARLALIRLRSIIVPNSRLCFKQDLISSPPPSLLLCLRLRGWVFWRPALRGHGITERDLVQRLGGRQWAFNNS